MAGKILLYLYISTKPNFRTTCKENFYFSERGILYSFAYRKCPFLSKHVHSAFQLGEEHGFDFETDSEGEVLIHLYTKGGAALMAKSLDGVFSFCLVDITKGKVFIGRDNFGVRPSFRLSTDNGMMAVCSEVKGEFMWYKRIHKVLAIFTHVIELTGKLNRGICIDTRLYIPLDLLIQKCILFWLKV